MVDGNIAQVRTQPVHAAFTTASVKKVTSRCFHLPLTCSQYAVPVTKYDRKGYKARPRQLLLTANSAVIVEEAKVKQRIDYGVLKGQQPEFSFS